MLRRIALVSIAALSLGAAVAFAQSAAPVAAPAAGHPQHMHHISRADMCMERFAHRAGHFAYIEARLNLTAEQKPLWAKWHEALAPGAEKAHALCMAHAAKPEMHPTIVQRAAFFQEMLATKAASLQAAQPALAALYSSLTTEQKAILDRPMGRWGHHHGHHDGDHDGKGGWHGHMGDKQKPAADAPKATP
jgi:hypothetical protein